MGRYYSKSGRRTLKSTRLHKNKEQPATNTSKLTLVDCDVKYFIYLLRIFDASNSLASY